MRRKSLVIGGIVAGTVALTSTAAFALYPVSVTASSGPNHKITGGTISGVAISGGTASFACGSSSLVGSSNYVTAGTLVDPEMTLGGVSFYGCTGTPINPVVTQTGTWHFRADSGATSAATDTAVVGRLTEVAFRVASPIPAVCTFTVTGEATATYDETTGYLKVNETGSTGNLEVAAVTGCGGTVSVGTPINLSATYQIGIGGIINIG